ncbi:MAG: insulinase family protein [Planctomycetes bacterium]|nr:insulinase family protein [Planctomycetota bacterium]
MMSASHAADPEKVASVEGITEYKLDNGFRFLLFPDDSKPQVTINCTIFVGSRHEGYGETGMAHLLEHMVFKGTPTHPNVPKSLRDHGAGSRFNGTTWVDRTNYYETMPASDENLEFGIKLEADRLVNSFVKREDLVSEMTVVRNEFESGENNPERVLSQRMMGSAFEWHNYGKSTIGNRSDIERVPIENLQAFYRKFYQADNCLLIVAGKFDQKKAIEYIVKYFGALKKPTRELPKTYTEEPAQDGERNVVLRRVGSVGAVGVVYHIPAGAHPDYPALEVLEETLTASPSGRVYKALVESKKASSISSSIYAWHDPGVLEITAKVEGAGVDAARDTLVETLETLQKSPITQEEVDRAKARFKTYNEKMLAATDSLAIGLSEWAACGDWRLFFLHRDRVEKVTADDVNRVAAKYLTRNNRTVGVYYPATKADRVEVPETPKVADLVNDYKGRAAVAQGEVFDTSPANIEKRVERGTFDGIKYALLPKKTKGEVVELRLNLHFGNEKSLTGQNVACNLLGSLMRRGTTLHTRQQLTDELDKLGAQLGISTDTGELSVSLQVKKANLLPALKIVAEILRSPSFPEAEFEILKRENLERLNRAKTEPTALAGQMLQKRLNPYPKENIRYVPTIEEGIARIDAVKLEDLKNIYAQIGASKGELAVVGDFEAAPVLDFFRGALKGWDSKTPIEPILRNYNFQVKGMTEKILTPDKANAVFIAGVMAPMTDSDPDYPALQVGNYLLGGAPLASRLSNRVRGEEGLSYGIGSMYSADARDKTSRMMIFAITNPKNMAKVDTIIGEEIGKFLKEGVSASELDEGKKAFVESMKLNRSSDGGLASSLASNLFQGRTFAFQAELETKLLGLQPADVSNAFKKFLDPAKLVIIQAGDFNKK